MYKLFKDKNENFECKLNLEGASLENARARLVLENDEFNIIFEGTIDNDGKCIVPIKKLKILSEDLKGKLKLEVIVENDTYFMPYEDDFIVSLNKKLTVEVISKQEENKKPIIEQVKKVTVEIENNSIPNIINEIYNNFQKNDIDIYNIGKQTKLTTSIIQESINKYKVDDQDLIKIKNQLLEKLSKNI